MEVDNRTGFSLVGLAVLLERKPPRSELDIEVGRGCDQVGRGGNEEEKWAPLNLEAQVGAENVMPDLTSVLLGTGLKPGAGGPRMLLSGWMQTFHLLYQCVFQVVRAGITSSA